jgi:hypothetical protein
MVWIACRTFVAAGQVLSSKVRFWLQRAAVPRRSFLRVSVAGGSSRPSSARKQFELVSFEVADRHPAPAVGGADHGSWGDPRPALE